MRIIVFFVMLLCGFCGTIPNSKALRGCWISENAVNSISRNDTTKTKKSIPVIGFDFDEKNLVHFLNYYDIKIPLNNRLLIQTFNSDINCIEFKKEINNNQTVYKLVNLYKYLNLLNFSEQEINEYKKSKIVLFIQNNRLILEISKNNKSVRYYFVNKINGKEFKTIDEGIRLSKSIDD